MSGFFCSEPGCKTVNNQTRKANKLCEQSPPRCAPCCQVAGGCRVHRISPNRIGTLSSAATSVASYSSSSTAHVRLVHPSEPLVPVRRYARPLNQNYARAWVQAHSRVRERAQEADAERKLEKSILNTVHVVIWTRVYCLHVQPLFSVSRVHARKMKHRSPFES